MTNILTNTLWCTVLLRDLARRESEMTQCAEERLAQRQAAFSHSANSTSVRS